MGLRTNCLLSCACHVMPVLAVMDTNAFIHDLWVPYGSQYTVGPFAVSSDYPESLTQSGRPYTIGKCWTVWRGWTDDVSLSLTNDLAQPTLRQCRLTNRSKVLHVIENWKHIFILKKELYSWVHCAPHHFVVVRNIAKQGLCKLEIMLWNVYIFGNFLVTYLFCYSSVLYLLASVFYKHV